MRSFSCVLAVAFAGVAFAQKAPKEAIATMTAGDGLQVELFASEPMLINPTSIDVDHLGRVWVAEAVNYRRINFNRPILRKEGDRIQVLVDKDGDGQADEAITFYQGKELYGPLSVCVIPSGKGLRVLVAQSPDILEFTCKDAAKPEADGPPTKFLTGFGGYDHDHGVHGLHLGPDGKLYFTVGDSGVTGLQSSDGKGKKYVTNNSDVQKGTVWRCDLDGKNVELIAHNFRNNYEACVDSFGEIWCSDNDDDGNEQTRICFVMPGGNYGYGPRGPGQSHWHEEQPGIVHKTLRTGFGSPCGIQFYEGTLLPKAFHNTLMHCDAGPREVRAFTRKAKGAGYELTKSPMLTSSDNWFRPSDVCTAPDGSVFVCDWYDSGVGGHGMGDWTRGRIYRLTPKGHKGYKVPEVKLDTKEGVLAALGSPNLAVQHLSRNVYIEAAKKPVREAFEALSKLAPPENDTRNFARMVQDVSAVCDSSVLLGLASELLKQKKNGECCSLAFRTISAEYSRLDNSRKKEMQVVNDRFLEGMPQSAIRELILVMQRFPTNEAVAGTLMNLAKLYDGTDRTYLSALNIACGTDTVRRDAILKDFEKHFPEWNDKVADLVWELRPKSMLPKMGTLLSDAKLTGAQKARIVDILASNDDASAGETMLKLLAGDATAEVKDKALANLKLFLPTKWNVLVKNGDIDTTIVALLASEADRSAGLGLIAAVQHTKSVANVAKFATDANSPKELKSEAIRTLGALNSPDSVKALKTALDAAPTKQLTSEILKAFAALAGKSKDQIQKDSLDVLSGVVLSKHADADIQRTAIEGLAGNRAGTGWLLAIKERGGLPKELDSDVGRLLRNSPFQGERNKAMILFPPPGKLDPKKLPPIAELAKKIGSAENGKQVMAKSLTSEVQCLKCHTVRGTGGNIGPDLSMIGKKGSKENLYDSLLTPSKAIADQYVSWRLDAEDGQSITGLLVGETETTLTIRDANGKDYQFPAKGTDKKKDPKSIMPEDLVKTLTEDELIDVVEYLMTLQTPSFTPDSWLIAGPFPAEGEKPFDTKLGELEWKTVRSDGRGYFDLAAHGGAKSPNSLSVLRRTIESPSDQEVTLLVGTDDGCRLSVNGLEVLSHDRSEAASPGRDAVKVKLKKGANAFELKISNGNNPHGYYFSIEGGLDLKIGK